MNVHNDGVDEYKRDDSFGRGRGGSKTLRHPPPESPPQRP